MYAAVVTEFGGPEVLKWQEFPDPAPGPGQIRIRVKAAGVGPTDLRIRSGALGRTFGLEPPFVLGFEAAGIVDQLGDGVTGVAIGDDVAALLPYQAGYAELVVAGQWTKKPASVPWDVAAAFPSSGEAALGVLNQLDVKAGENLVLYGAGGSVGLIAIQLAVAKGVNVFGVARKNSEELVTSLGATFVPAEEPLEDAVTRATASVDAVMDAGGVGGLETAIALTGGTKRVITLSDKSGGFALGVKLSSMADNRAPESLDVEMPMLASGELVLKPRITMPMRDAAKAHAAMEGPGPHQKIVLLTD